MDRFKEIEKVVDSDEVKMGLGFADLIDSHLQLGASRWAVRYGALGDGHEKITNAQKYFQAIKEMYLISSSMELQKASALEYKASILDAEEILNLNPKESDMLRAQAAKMRAQSHLATALVTIKDQMRQFDEFNKIRLELKDEIERKYPDGIEQAEPDNWKARFDYRMIKQQAGFAERIDNIPLPQEVKATLGFEYGRLDATASCRINKPEQFKVIEEAFREKAMKLAKSKLAEIEFKKKHAGR